MKFEPPLPNRPNGNEVYECPPLRPEDDYMMSGALGPGSPVHSSTSHSHKDAGNGKDGVKEGEVGTVGGGGGVAPSSSH